MIHYLRDSENNTIVEIVATLTDVYCSIDILNYTRRLLLIIDADKKKDFAIDIDMLSEIKGMYFEFSNELAEKECKRVAEKWLLNYVTD